MINVELKAEGNNGSGKSRILEEIKEYLESRNLKVENSQENEHKLVISGELD